MMILIMQLQFWHMSGGWFIIMKSHQLRLVSSWSPPDDDVDDDATDREHLTSPSTTFGEIPPPPLLFSDMSTQVLSRPSCLYPDWPLITSNILLMVPPKNQPQPWFIYSSSLSLCFCCNQNRSLFFEGRGCSFWWWWWDVERGLLISFHVEDDVHEVSHSL